MWWRCTGGERRAFDALAAAAGLLLLAPILAVIGALIKLDDGGPVLFAQTRVGRFGRPFQMLKFRTMVTDADQRGGLLTVQGDPRTTRLGRILRAAKLDELPQLVNVLIGDMSLVGPRPELQKYVALYDAVQRRVLELQPGITDPASIAYRDESKLLARPGSGEVLHSSDHAGQDQDQSGVRRARNTIDGRRHSRQDFGGSGGSTSAPVRIAAPLRDRPRRDSGRRRRRSQSGTS